MPDLPSELRDLLLQNSMTADEANGPGHVVPVDKAAAICLMTAQREVAKVRIAHSNRELLAVSTKILAALSAEPMAHTVEDGELGMARVAVRRARVLLDLIEQQTEEDHGGP